MHSSDIGSHAGGIGREVSTSDVVIGSPGRYGQYRKLTGEPQLVLAFVLYKQLSLHVVCVWPNYATLELQMHALIVRNKSKRN